MSKAVFRLFPGWMSWALSAWIGSWVASADLMAGAGPVASPGYGEKDDVLPAGAGMALRGAVLFTTAGSESFAKAKRLIAVDLADPASPAILGAVALEGFPQDLALTGDMAWVVDGRRLVGIDVKDPRAMTVISETRVSDDPVHGPQGIVVDGSSAYLACRRGGVVQMDVSDPRKPVVVSTVDTPFSRGVARGTVGNETFLVSADDTQGVSVVKDGRIVFRQRLASGSAARVHVAGERVFVASGDALLSVFTLTPSGALKPVCERISQRDGGFYGTYGYGVLPEAAGAWIAAGESGLLFADLADPLHPVCAEAAAFPEAPLLRAVIRNGNYLYVNGGTLDGRTLLFVLEGTVGSSAKPVGELLDLSAGQ